MQRCIYIVCYLNDILCQTLTFPTFENVYGDKGGDKSCVWVEVVSDSEKREFWKPSDQMLVDIIRS